MEIGAVGIGLGKTTFHLVALGEAGKVLVLKKFTQRQPVVFTREHVYLLDRSGSLLWSALSGPYSARAGSQR